MPESHAKPRDEPLVGRVRNPPAEFVELGVTTDFSFLRGASTAAELVAAAHALGHDALGVADLNSLAGVVRLHAAAKEVLRPVIGARIVLACGTGFLAYPADRAAYGRLSSLISKGRRADLEGAWQKKGVCDLSLPDLAAHAEGLHLVWLPPAELDAGLAALPDLVRALPKLRHVAAAYLYRGDDVARINRLDRAARALGLSLLATNDVHYHAAERRPLQDVMTCIRHGVTIGRAGQLLDANAERHLKSPSEMAALFSRWPHAIRATRKLADACRFSLDELQYEYPRETVPEGRSPDSHLAELTRAGAYARYGNALPDKVRAALDKELALIAKKRIAQYFLTIHEIVGFARSRQILCQGRGSAANSAVCFVLGITPVDPAEQELFFERFISEDRTEPPDIDVDFEHERREEVIQHIYEKYGRHRAGLCATVIHYRPRSAIREVGKVMGLSEDVTSALAGTVWGSWGGSMGEASTDQAGLDLRDPHLRRVVKLAGQLIGKPRHLSQHVGGFILTENALSETVPIGNGAMPERSFIEWDKGDIDELRILKIDILALGMLTCIRKCFDLVRAHGGPELTLADIPSNDPRTYKMLRAGDTIGVFQVESRAQMNMLPRLKPKTFYDLVIEVAIVRPGPIQGDMVHPYLHRRDRPETVTYPTPIDPMGKDELRDILARTLGIPIFQEQAMKIAMVAAEFSPAEVNELRKAMATFRSRGTIGRLEDKMVGRMMRRGYEPAFAQRCFNQIKGFGDYGFPESHAAAFAHLVYVSAFLHSHHPAAFAAALLNSQPMGFYAPAQIVRDARDHEVELRVADVNFSDWDNTLEPASKPPAQQKRQGENLALRLGLRQIEGLGRAAALRIMAARDRPYVSLEDLRDRARLDAKAVRLISAGDALGSMGLNRRQALWESKALRDAPDLPLFRESDAATEGAEPAVTLPLMPVHEEVVADYQTLRLSLKAHPMHFLRRSLTRQGYASTADLDRIPQGAALGMAGLVLVRQRPGSAKGVCFITIEDEFGVANLVIWEKTFTAFRKAIMGARVLAVRGRLQRSGAVTHIVAEELVDRSDVLLRLAGQAPAQSPGQSGGQQADTASPQIAPLQIAPPQIASPRAGHPRQVRIVPKSRDFH